MYSSSCQLYLWIYVEYVNGDRRILGDPFWKVPVWPWGSKDLMQIQQGLARPRWHFPYFSWDSHGIWMEVSWDLGIISWEFMGNHGTYPVHEEFDVACGRRWEINFRTGKPWAFQMCLCVCPGVSTCIHTIKSQASWHWSVGCSPMMSVLLDCSSIQVFPDAISCDASGKLTKQW